MAQNIPRGTPARVLVLLTLLVGGAVVSAWRDALRQAQNTWVFHPTALGDAALLQPDQLPVYLNTGGKIVNLTSSGGTLQRRDDRMFRVQTATEGDLPFTLFSNRENLTGHADPKLFARTAPGQYIRLRAGMGAVKTNTLESLGSDPAAPFGPSPTLGTTDRQPPKASSSRNAPAEEKEITPAARSLEPEPADTKLPEPSRASTKNAPSPEKKGSPAPTRAPEEVLETIPKAMPLPPEEQDFPVKPEEKRTL